MGMMASLMACMRRPAVTFLRKIFLWQQRSEGGLRGGTARGQRESPRCGPRGDAVFRRENEGWHAAREGRTQHGRLLANGEEEARARAHLSDALHLAQEFGTEVQALLWLGRLLLRLLARQILLRGLPTRLRGPPQRLRRRDAGRGPGYGAREEQRPDGQRVEGGYGREDADSPQDQPVLLPPAHALELGVPRENCTIARHPRLGRGRGVDFPDSVCRSGLIVSRRRSSSGTRSGAGAGAGAQSEGGAHDAGAALAGRGAMPVRGQYNVSALPGHDPPPLTTV